jgi:hypothetical protein
VELSVMGGNVEIDDGRHTCASLAVRTKGLAYDLHGKGGCHSSPQSRFIDDSHNSSLRHDVSIPYHGRDSGTTPSTNAGGSAIRDSPIRDSR